MSLPCKASAVAALNAPTVCLRRMGELGAKAARPAAMGAYHSVDQRKLIELCLSCPAPADAAHNAPHGVTTEAE